MLDKKIIETDGRLRELAIDCLRYVKDSGLWALARNSRFLRSWFYDNAPSDLRSLPGACVQFLVRFDIERKRQLRQGLRREGKRTARNAASLFRPDPVKPS